MGLGRLAHYAVDAVLLSAVLAGVKKSSGFAFDTSNIHDPNIRLITEKYLRIGESAFDVVQATAMKSPYCKDSGKSSM
ncbi:hypothetical protein M378DRAFT_73768 [Amanita muscaria Koide BX008]|uniref:DUF1748-domain-containing protein n=1 Tax=Amanita muscaria (strain Koide BX008) TaxID=946122 RepID=A0A0C2X013_AMAMK|nr:hypothetical protein M378DRAFT_73768 [Amanita muscaria Koide BX008]